MDQAPPKSFSSWLESVEWLGSSQQASESRLGKIPRIKIDFTTNPEDDEVNYLKQVHSATILQINTKSKASTRIGDGLWTSEPEQPIGVRTADCLPVLIGDSKGKAVMALHAGWRGCAQGILTAGIKLLEAASIPIKDLYVFLGPCISMEKFEVGPEVCQKFFEISPRLRKQQNYWLKKGRDDRWHIDLAGFVLQQLFYLKIPASQITVWKTCTYSDAHLWPSFRRQGKGMGHLCSQIAIQADSR